MPASAALRDIEIARPGRFLASDGQLVELTEAQLRELAESYDPAIAEAPFVIGHPKTNDPAYGWVGGLRLQDGRLVVTEGRQVVPEFAALLAAGRFKKRSASLWPPQHPGNPRPGKWYLRHVGYLGAAAPAIPGLKDIQLAGEADGVLTVELSSPWTLRSIASTFRRLREWLIGKHGIEEADQVIPAFLADDLDREALREELPAEPVPAFSQPAAPAPTVTGVPVMPDQNTQTVDLAQREQALTEREREIQAREARLAEHEALRRREDITDFVQGLADAGRVLPRHVAPLVELMASLDDSQPIEFAQGSEKVQRAPSAALRAFLAELPAQIQYGAKSDDSGQAAAAVEFAAPAGAIVAPDRLALHHQALAWQQQHPGTDYLAAVRAVGG
jgi:hypothetical protein